jgi:hypothetical protein
VKQLNVLKLGLFCEVVELLFDSKVLLVVAVSNQQKLSLVSVCREQGFVDVCTANTFRVLEVKMNGARVKAALKFAFPHVVEVINDALRVSKKFIISCHILALEQEPVHAVPPLQRFFSI